MIVLNLVGALRQQLIRTQLVDAPLGIIGARNYPATVQPPFHDLFIKAELIIIQKINYTDKLIEPLLLPRTT